MKILILNIIFYSLFIVFTAIAIPLFSLFVFFVRIFLSRRQTMRRFRRAISWYGKIIIKVLPFGLVKVIYKDYEQSNNGQGVIFVCNHRSASDPFLMACLPYEAIQVVNMWPFRLPILGIFARWAGYLSIREMPFEDFLEKAGKLLKEGVSMVTFPEGTRSTSKTMGQFHSSVFRLALEVRCPIVPMCISGSENIPAKGTRLLEPGKIRVYKLKRLQWADYKDLTPFTLKNKVRDSIAQHLAVVEAAS